MSFLLPAFAGVVIAVVPAALLRGLMNGAGRSNAIAQATAAALVTAAALLVGLTHPLAMLTGAAVTIAVRVATRKVTRARAGTPDIVVERTLLDDALSPNLAASLTRLEAEMRANAASGERLDTPAGA